MRIEINEHIVTDNDICGGVPTFKGTRIMVWQVLDMLRGGLTTEEILEDYPSLSEEHIKAALKYAADLMRGGDNVQFSVPLH
jgi:uncharacterized protein (DUF433 family)